jgi:hypothetical protein
MTYLVEHSSLLVMLPSRVIDLGAWNEKLDQFLNQTHGSSKMQSLAPQRLNSYDIPLFESLCSKSVLSR